MLFIILLLSFASCQLEMNASEQWPPRKNHKRTITYHFSDASGSGAASDAEGDGPLLFSSMTVRNVRKENIYVSDDSSDSNVEHLGTAKQATPFAFSCVPLDFKKTSKKEAIQWLENANAYYKKTQEGRPYIVEACERIIEHWDPQFIPFPTRAIIRHYLYDVTRLKKYDVTRLKKDEWSITQEPYQSAFKVEKVKRFNSMVCFVDGVHTKGINPALLTAIVIESVPLKRLLPQTTKAIFKTCRRLQLLKVSYTNIKELEAGVLYNPPVGMQFDCSNNKDLAVISPKAIKNWSQGRLDIHNCEKLLWPEIEHVFNKESFLDSLFKNKLKVKCDYDLSHLKDKKAENKKRLVRLLSEDSD